MPRVAGLWASPKLSKTAACNAQGKRCAPDVHRAAVLRVFPKLLEGKSWTGQGILVRLVYFSERTVLSFSDHNSFV